MLTRFDRAETLSVPDHGELDRGTLRSIVRSAGLTIDEFLEASR